MTGPESSDPESPWFVCDCGSFRNDGTDHSGCWKIGQCDY